MSVAEVHPRVRDLTATARVTRRAKSFCFCDVSILGDEERLVAQGIVTYKIA